MFSSFFFGSLVKPIHPQHPKQQRYKMGGHGHDHGHHHEPYKVPKPEIYKVGNIPELIMVQEELAKRGLKDPWIR